MKSAERRPWANNWRDVRGWRIYVWPKKLYVIDPIIEYSNSHNIPIEISGDFISGKTNRKQLNDVLRVVNKCLEED